MLRTLFAAAIAVAVSVPSAAAVIPRPAPDLTITFPGGQTTKISQHRGKVVVLEFLLTTCPHCQQSSQKLDKLYQELGPKGVVVLGAAVNDNAIGLVPEYIRNFKITHQVGVASRDDAIAFLQHPIMTSMMMPQVVFIDRQGQIQAQFPGNDKFYAEEEKNAREIIQKLLGPAAAPAAKRAAPAKKGS